MSALWRVSLAALAGGCLACGCSARAACHDERWSEAPNVEAEHLMGTESFDTASQPATHALELRLSNLPELWQGSKNVFNGYVALTISTEYAGDPKGNDGKTQMPQVTGTLSLEGADQDVTIGTSSRANGSAESSQLRLFESCDDEATQPGCCPYGSRECTVPLRLSVNRLDGAPFPPVNVARSVQSAANVTSCPLDAQVQVKLALSEVAQ